MILYVVLTYGDHHDNYSDEMKQNIFILDVAATYLELLLGIQQVSSMYELYLMIKTSVMQIEASQSEKSSFVTEKSGLPYFSLVQPPGTQ